MKNRFWQLLLSLVIAFGIWAYVITVVSPEAEKTYYDIPVIMQNENILAERGLMIVSENPTVTLKLRGNRTDLMKLNEANINVLTNVASIEAPGTHMLGYNIAYPGNISGNSVSKQSGSPALISLSVENRIKKSVPVVLHYTGAVPEGFIADKENAVLDYPSIEMSGPESVISQIDQAAVQVDLDGQSKTIVGDSIYTLCDKNGNPVDAALVTTNVDRVNITVKIQRVKEIKLSVEVIDGGGATGEDCEIHIEPESIRVSGSDAALADMEELVIGTIDLAKILTDETLEFPISLDENIVNETGVANATVHLKFPTLITKNFDISNIVPLNVPEGLEVDMITQALTVKIRGPREVMNAMRTSDITVTVDFQNAEIGTATMKAEVTLGEGFTAAGALNTYSVSATLREPDNGKKE